MNCRKRNYTSDNDPKALKHIRQLRKKGFENLQVYHCERCGHYHVGHKIGTPKKLDFLFGRK